MLTTKHETGGLRTWDIPFDSELSEVTISITGENRRVKVRFKDFFYEDTLKRKPFYYCDSFRFKAGSTEVLDSYKHITIMLSLRYD